MNDFKVGHLLRIFVDEHDVWHGRALHEAILELLAHEEMSGASVFRGIEGFGAHRQSHAAALIGSHRNLPIVIEVLDTEEKIGAVIPRLETMLGEGTMTLERAEYWISSKR